LPLKAKVFFWLTIVSGAFVSYWFLPSFNYNDYNLIIIGFLVIFAFFSEIYEIEILPQHGVSVSTAIYMSVVYLGGSPLAMAVTLPAVLFSEVFQRLLPLDGKTSLKLSLERVFFNTSQAVVSIAISGLVFKSLGGHPPPFEVAYDYLPPILSFLAFMLANISFVSGIISLSEGESFFYQLRINLRDLPVQYLSLSIISILIVVTYKTSPWNVFLVTILLILANTSVNSYFQLRKQARRTFEKVLNLLEKRDPYTHKHSESVGGLTRKIAEELKIYPEQKKNIVSAARVHDIGKLGIPDSILLKEDGLTEDEWEVMEEHPVLGADILSELKIYKDSVDVVRYEHERWDGSGYPEGLEGEEIPLGSRIVAVADVWNALRTKRPYRGPMAEDEAKEVIKEMSGEKLDPQVVDALLKIIESEAEE